MSWEKIEFGRDSKFLRRMKMVIQKVNSREDTIECNELLTKLIINEATYDKNLRTDYKVKEYFENIYENKNNALFIAKEENNIAGYAYCKIITSENGPQIYNIVLLDGLYINEKYRKQGIATKLIEECKKWAVNIGAKIFEVNVLAENEKAIELYRKVGFNEFEKKMRLKL